MVRYVTKNDVYLMFNRIPKPNDIQVALAVTPPRVSKRGWDAWTLETAVEALRDYYRRKIRENLERQAGLRERSKGSTVFAQRAAVYRARLEKIEQIWEEKRQR